MLLCALLITCCEGMEAQQDITPRKWIEQMPSETPRTDAITVGFLDPMFGYFSATFERYIKKKTTYELGLGIIGLGNNIDQEAPRGAFVSGAYRFYFSPSRYCTQNFVRHRHPLEGGYFKTQIILERFSWLNTETSYSSITNPPTFNTSTTRVSNTSVVLMLNFGHQYVFDNRFVIDWSAGLGYSIILDNGGADTYNYYGYWSFPRYSTGPVVTSLGLKIGLLK